MAPRGFTRPTRPSDKATALVGTDSPWRLAHSSGSMSPACAGWDCRMAHRPSTLIPRNTASASNPTLDSGAYFPESNVGFEAEAVFLGMSVEGRCAIRQSQPAQAGDIDPELCASLQGESVPTSAVALSLGLVGRVNPRGAMSPYLRLDAGLVARTRGTIAMTG